MEHESQTDAAPRLPYGFARYPDGSPRRTTPTGHDVFEGQTGQIECELEALSPFLVMDSDHRAGSNPSELGTFMSGDDGRYIIPGTSLKGMIRSVFEVIIPSCVAVNSSNSNRLVPGRFSACKHRTNLCPACRTFGYMGRGRGATVHRGRVNIGEARAVGSPQRHRDVQLVPHFSPNPGKSDRYQTAGRDPKGRKFYYHHHDLKTATTHNDKDYGPWVAPLEAGSTFRFTVGFENLEEEALDALVAALVLSSSAPLDGSTVKVRHKLGYGKPAGLGSVRIGVQEVRLDPPPETRYRDFQADPQTLDDQDAWVETRRSRFFEDPTPPVKDLVEVLRYPPPAGVRYAYPQQ
jgi:CRISPR/Cas system CSM-associated protein Csm3 (group 7 of RAMP superfamily)